jgi:hypothetical protein
MKSAQKYCVTVMVLLAGAAAQVPAGSVMVQSVSAVKAGTDVRVEIRLTSPVTPSVDTAVDPDRILLDLPGASCTANTKNVLVNLNGVRRVRTGQHSTTPLVTRVVLDLDSAHPYTLKTEGNRVILTVGPAENAGKVFHGAPVAATSGNLIGVFRHKRETEPPAVQENSAYNPVPTPAPPAATSGPAFSPPAPATSASTLPAPPPPVAQGQPVTVPSQNPQPPPAVAQPQAASASQPENAASTPAQGTTPPVAAPVSPPAPTTVAKAEKPTPAAVAPASPVASTPANTEVSTPAAPTETPSAKSTSATANIEVSAPVSSSAPAPDSAAAPSIVAVPETAATGAAAPGAAPTTSSSTDATLLARPDDPSLHTVFKVKYVADGVAYLDGGRGQGLTEGMKLEIMGSNLPARQGESANTADPRIVAELVVSAVAETSAVTDIHAPKRPVVVGDLAYLSSTDADALVQQRALSATRQYPAVISFTEGDTLDEEVRQEVPKPPLPSVNRARGRIGFDTIETVSHGTSSVTSSDVGIAFQGEITRIGGTHWNLSGYERAELTHESALAAQTLQETMNRTYHLNMIYDNPDSLLVAGFGRFYLPWAPSLDTIDGGYFGVKLSKGSTLGVFAGSTPDPASWDYNPSQAIIGNFINFEGGDYNGFHYSTTTGAGLQMIHWAANDPFLFFEDQLSYKRTFSIYESAQIDSPKGTYTSTGTVVTPAPGTGLGRNFFTFRVDPFSRLELDANYNYFREIPTFDPTLIGTGLLDKYLFQGFSAGGRLEIFNQVWVSTNLGRSSGTGDAKSSLNQMYGITFNRLPFLNLRADLHYSSFSSSYGTGNYSALSLSRQMNQRMNLQVLLGQQTFASPITANTNSKFVTGTVETTLGPHYYLQGNFTTNRGDMNYDQVMLSFGYRFDSKRKGE